MDPSRFFISAAAMPLAALAVGLAAATAGEPVRIDPTTLGPGPLGADFTTGRTGGGSAGDWRVVPDASAPGGRVIAQLSADPTDHRFPLAIYQGVTARDVAVEIGFRPVAGKVDQAGGIAVRLSSPDDYYVVRANALEDNVRFYRVVKGRRTEIRGADVTVAPNQWHRLGLRAEGDRFTVTFDGRTLFTATDRTFAGDGRVALWTKADSVTHFDAVTIQPLP